MNGRVVIDDQTGCSGWPGALTGQQWRCSSRAPVAGLTAGAAGSPDAESSSVRAKIAPGRVPPCGGHWLSIISVAKLRATCSPIHAILARGKSRAGRSAGRFSAAMPTPLSITSMRAGLVGDALHDDLDSRRPGSTFDGVTGVGEQIDQI